VAVLLALAASSAACSEVRANLASAQTPDRRVTVKEIRGCLDKRPGRYDGLLFRTTTRPSDSFVGVIMMDLTTRPTRTATVGIAVFDDEDLLDAYEDRARQDPTDEVTRVENAVVSYNTPTSPRLQRGVSWVDACLHSP
jgi:hypothetical protein